MPCLQTKPLGREGDCWVMENWIVITHEFYYTIIVELGYIF